MTATKKILSIILSLIVVMSLFTSFAFAGEGGVEGEGEGEQPTVQATENRYEGDVGNLTDIVGGDMFFDKYLVLNKNADVPDVTFKFTIEAATAGDVKGEQIFIAPMDKNDVNPAPAASDSSAYNVIGKPVFVNGTDVEVPAESGSYKTYVGDTALLKYKLGDTTYLESTYDRNTDFKNVHFFTPANTDEKVAEKRLRIDFSGVTFLEPGVYRYVITEVSGETDPLLPGMNYDYRGETPSGTSGELYLDVYVVDSGGGLEVKSNTEITNYVLHESSAAPEISQDTAGTADVSSMDEELADKTTGFTNVYLTKSLEFKKEVTGNQASRDKFFKYTVKVEYDGELFSSAKYEVDMTNATLTPSANVATKYSLTELAENRNLTTPADGKLYITGAQLKAGKVFYLQHGQSIKIKNLPATATYTVTEDKEDYISTPAGVDNYKNETSGTLNAQDNYKRTAPSESDPEPDDVVFTSFLNGRNGIIPTGILTVIGPAAAVIVVAAVGLGIVFASKKKKARR